MCVAVAPARFGDTIVYAGEARHNGEVVHVAGYQNSAQSLVRPPPERRSWLERIFGGSDRPRTGNAMILHFPAQPGSMTQANVIDTAGCPKLLDDMRLALRGPMVATAAPAQAAPTADHVEVFESGIYTVVLASDARAIPGALDEVPARKRPPLNDELFAWYHATFPGWPVALCCFDNADKRKATPMLWWYRPLFPEWLFAPAVDAHTGAAPDLTAKVRVDHWVIAGSYAMEPGDGAPVRYRDALPPHMEAWLPDQVVGSFHRGMLANADFVLPVEAVRAGRAPTERRLLTAA